MQRLIVAIAHLKEQLSQFHVFDFGAVAPPVF